MKNHKLTNKEIKAILTGLEAKITDIHKVLQFLGEKAFQREEQFLLYLKLKKEEETYRKFVTEYNEQSGLQDKEGT